MRGFRIACTLNNIIIDLVEIYKLKYQFAKLVE